MHLLVCELRRLDIPFVGNKLAEHNAQMYCGLLMKTFGISLREEHRLHAGFWWEKPEGKRPL